MADANAKQLVAERIQQSTNILITVEKDPSVDELAAAIALTLMLNKMDKHPTAVFSGAIPPAINFLEPGKTFEDTIDSLRDFIIALDKEKADRLRYKVEEDVVKIFITPYRSRISEKDLEFSQGDFNVELVVALGVEKRESLDKAITAHGRILHDATVVTISARDESSTLGSIDWHDGASSSICEMLSNLADQLQGNLLDQQVSTALLTGIVAATGRFSNPKTTSQTMSTAAHLMGAGANQQLIAANLQQAAPKEAPPSEDEVAHTSPKFKREEGKAEEEIQEEGDTSRGEIKVAHEEKETPTASTPKKEEKPAPTEEEKPETTPGPLQDELTRAMEVGAGPKPTPEPPKEKEPSTAKPTPLAKEAPQSSQITPLGNALKEKPNWQSSPLEPPQLGGTFNATSAEVEALKRQQEQEGRNETMLSHDEGGSQVAEEPPAVSPSLSTSQPKAAPPAGKEKDLDAARQAVTDALSAQQTTPQQAQTIIDHDEDEATLQPTEPASTTTPLPQPPQAAPQTQPLTPPSAQDGGLPPLPNFNDLPPLPPLPNSQTQQPPLPPNNTFPQPPSNLPPTSQPPIQPGPGQIIPPHPNDPGQFRIPGQ